MKIRAALWCLNVTVIAAAASGMAAQAQTDSPIAQAHRDSKQCRVTDSFGRWGGLVPGVLRVVPRSRGQRERACGGGDESDAPRT